jgi:hypothetical protein
VGNRIGRPEKSAGLPILLAVLTAWVVGVPALLVGLFLLATATHSAP